MWYQDPKFKRLQQTWYQKLKKSGFEDLEDKNENLKSPDIRTQNYEDREQLLQFHSVIDKIILEYPLPKLHKQVLELYSNGERLTTIAIKVKRSYPRIKQIVYLYKSAVKTIHFPLR